MNYAVLKELRKSQLSITATSRYIKYWLKVRDENNPNSQLQQFYYQQCEDNIPISNKNWAFQKNNR